MGGCTAEHEPSRAEVSLNYLRELYRINPIVLFLAAFSWLLAAVRLLANAVRGQKRKER
jgi:hypothetical protein